MRIPSEGKLLRIFIGEADKWQGQPLYEAIVQIGAEGRHGGSDGP